jgi:hypothetical protein
LVLFFCQVWLQCLSKIFDYRAHAVCFCTLVTVLDPPLTFIILRNIPSIPSFLTVFIIKGCWILWKVFFFFASIERIMWFLSLLLLYAVLCSWSYIWQPILASLEWNRLGLGVWCLWCVVEFYLPVFYWESLHLYSLKILVYNSLFWLCLHLF